MPDTTTADTVLADLDALCERADRMRTEVMEVASQLEDVAGWMGSTARAATVRVLAGRLRRAASRTE